MSLAQQLRRRSPEALAAADDAALDALLSKRLAAARARFPSVQLDDAEFIHHLGAHVPATLAELEAAHLEDLFLATACARGDHAALAELETCALSLLPRWTARFSSAAADDVQQEVRQKLLVGPDKQILRYSGKSAIAAWIRVVAVRTAIDLDRAKKSPSADELDDLWAGPDPELDAVKLHDLQALRAALHDALQSLPSRDRRLLRLHYIEGMSLERLALMEQVHRATVARWLSDARAGALDRVRALLAERLRLSTADGESMLRLLRSRLDLSFRRALERSQPA